ncbi:MAG: GNAT family N-acetyltransferase [Vulcanimicrobiaceae bacterium]
MFQLAFADEHGSRFRGPARPAAFIDVWKFIQRTEPDGFLAARDGDRVVGYAIFVRSLKAIQRKALLSGTALRWALRALSGKYGLRLNGMWRILRNKLLFVASGQKYRTKGDAQLLNVAVRPSEQGHGVATALIEEGLRVMAKAGVTEVRLEVRPWNVPAVEVYRKTGWHEAGRTRDGEGEWLVMIANPQTPRVG